MKNPEQQAYPLAMNFRKLQRYNFKFLLLDEVVFLEYLLVLRHEFNRDKVYKSIRATEADTGIKRTRQSSIIKKFLGLGLLACVEVEGMPQVRYFTLDIQTIFRLIPKVYKCHGNAMALPTYIPKSDVGSSLNRADFDKDIADFYTKMVEPYLQEKNIQEESKEVRKEEGPAAALEKDFVELPFLSQGFQQAWHDWVWHCCEIGVETTRSLAYSELSKLSNFSEHEAIKIIEFSINEGYKSLQPERFLGMRTRTVLGERNILN